jgi:hypothetical protein
MTNCSDGEDAVWDGGCGDTECADTCRHGWCPDAPIKSSDQGGTKRCLRLGDPFESAPCCTHPAIGKCCCESSDQKDSCARCGGPVHTGSCMAAARIESSDQEDSA